MDVYEMFLERLIACAEHEVDCDSCVYSEYGCSRGVIMDGVVEVLNGFIHPESSGMYDLEEIHENVTVQIWKNSLTGERSVGWYSPDNFEED